MNLNNKIINIYGPTITKKTGLAVFVAKYIWGKYGIEPVLINADSRKVYEDLNIGQVKIDPPWDKKLKVHLNKFHPLNLRFSLFDYKNAAEELIDKSLKDGKLPIMFGGTGVYHLSIIENWNVPRKGDSNKDEKEFKYAVYSSSSLNPKNRRGTSYKLKNIQRNNKKRPESFSYEHNYGKSEPKYQSLVLLPFIEKEKLFPAVKGHIEEHFKQGLFQEAKKLCRKYGFTYENPNWNAMLDTIGYREFLEYSITNKISLEAINTRELNLIKKNMFANLKEMVRKQIRLTDNFKDYKIVAKFEESKPFVDEFLS